jgi:hypothetical protein
MKIHLQFGVVIVEIENDRCPNEEEGCRIGDNVEQVGDDKPAADLTVADLDRSLHHLHKQELSRE